MRAFTRDFGYHAADYFPRRGTWDYVSRTGDHTGRADGVAVYAEPSELRPWRSPIIICLPIDRTGSFQPYTGYFPC